MKRLLTVTCVFMIGASVWLIFMENVLKHPGYGQRCLIDALLTIQAALTIVVSSGRAVVLRYPVLVGGIAICWAGGDAIYNILRSSHFEGFVLVIGSGLVVEGLLTLATLLRAQSTVPRPQKAGANA